MERDEIPRLPDALSDLLEAAVEESEAIERDDRYELYMFSWHNPTIGVCQVCMAGALIARRLRAPIDRPAFPDWFDEEEASKLFAIDTLRRGDLLALEVPGSEAQRAALRTATLSIRASFDRQLGRAPWSVYREAVATLRGAGL